MGVPCVCGVHHHVLEVGDGRVSCGDGSIVPSVSSVHAVYEKFE